jgi:hypothetical protein
MTYVANYTAEDVSVVVVDGATKVLVGAIAFASIMGLLLGIVIIAWLYKKAKK